MRHVFTQADTIDVRNQPATYLIGTAMTVADSGPATPYGASASIFGAATVTDLDVTLYGVTHTDPGQFDVLLVGPDGTQVTLMSDAGDSAVNDVDVTFDDDATFSLPSTGFFTDGTYRPTNFEGADAFPAPAPAATGATSLEAFEGRLGDGLWRLYVVDDTPGLGGSIADWRLSMHTRTAPYPSSIVVSGLGAVTDVDLHLDGLSLQRANSLDLLLESPDGRVRTVLSETGGTGGAGGMAGVDLVLDDEAATALPMSAPLTSGTFQPANYGASDFFPPPAPVDNGSSALSGFDGADPNGTWHLWAVDSVGGYSGLVASWSLDIEWSDATGPVGSVTVAGGTALATSAQVGLSTSAADPAPGTGVASMRFSNDGVTWSPMQAYGPAATWTLAPGADGPRTVYAQYADGVGNLSAVVSDTITLDVTAPTATKIKPGRGAKDVRKRTKIKVFASEPLDPGSVTKKAVILKRGKKKIAAKVSLKNGTKVVLTPRKPLARGKYKVTVTQLVTDLAGHAFDGKPTPGTQTLTWKFTV